MFSRSFYWGGFFCWFFFLILFFINASLDSLSSKYLYLYIDLNSLKGVNIFLMSLGNFFLLFLFLFFWRFEGFWSGFFNFFKERELCSTLLRELLFPFGNFQQWGDESLQTPNKELNLVILWIWPCRFGNNIPLSLKVSPFFSAPFPVNTQKSSFGAVKETDVPWNILPWDFSRFSLQLLENLLPLFPAVNLCCSFVTKPP